MTRSIPTVLASLAAFACLLSPPAAPADVLSDVFNLDAGLTSLELVSVGDAGNARSRVSHGPGKVDYTYVIGKYEVTNAQYAVFLNAVARDNSAQNDPYNLVNSKMQIVFGGGQYSAKNGFENHPVTYVSWGDAARFVNWLHHGQPSGTLIGDGNVADRLLTEGGAYTLDGALSSADLSTVDRNAGARYWLPSEDEWYKAAYYDPTGAGRYWKYPTQSDDDPGTDTDEDTNEGNNANYDAAIGTTKDVGEFQLSSSYYGTFDQGGNVAEWTDVKNGQDAYVFGGSYLSFAEEFASDNINYRLSSIGSREKECGSWGFRIAGVPEPGGMAALIGMAAVGFVWFWRRR